MSANSNTYKGYEIMETIGTGAFGSVFKVKKDETHFAMKIVGDGSSVLKEFDMLEKVQHPNVLKAIETKGTHCMVTELAEAGSLESQINNGGLSEQQMKPLVEDILNALLHLEKQSIVHFDLKPANILLKKTRERIIAVLGDFGCAREISEISKMKKSAGTNWYMSEEMYQGQFSQVNLNDIYSLGITMKEMTVGIKEYRGVLDKTFDSCASKELKDFVKCAMKGANERPSAKKLLKHRWLRKSFTELLCIMTKKLLAPN